MALIDKDQMKAEIRRRLSLIYLLKGDFTDGSRDAYEGLLSWLDSLPEQPKLKPMNIPSAGGGMSTIPPSHKLYVKTEQLIGLDDENAADKKAVKEIVKTVHKEVTRQVKEILARQPVEGQEEAARKAYPIKMDTLYDCYGNAEEVDINEKARGAYIAGRIAERKLRDSNRGSDDLEKEIDEEWGPYDQMGFDLTKSQFADIARHFYELGCRHTAVMYDDIEHERQRAEEAELSGDLEEEIDRVLNDNSFLEIIGSGRFKARTINYRKIARHFAEWGAKHLKK